MIAELSCIDDAAPTWAIAGWFDEPTGLPGPDFWDVVLTTEAARWARYHHLATVVLVEIVGLDDLLRSWGRDVALRSVADVGRTLRSGCRSSDYVARLDQARFAVLLTGTDEIAAINMVERVRVSCERSLRAMADSTRIAFGWASPTGSSSLLAAARIAEERLRGEVDSA